MLGSQLCVVLVQDQCPGPCLLVVQRARSGQPRQGGAEGHVAAAMVMASSVIRPVPGSAAT
jgi:hypothetical protein